MSVFYEVETKKEKVNEEELSVACFVLLTNNSAFNLPEGENSYSVDLLGRPMFEFVTRVCPTRPVTIECREEDNPLDVIKPYLRDKELTLVLYGDTPLLTKGNINNILNFVLSHELNVCKLSRGYVFKTDYIKRVDEIFAPQTYFFAEEEFNHPTNLKELASISKTLERKIIDYHLEQGVRFVDTGSVYIEGDVSINSGAIIGPMVSLCGETKIGQNVKIGAFSKINSSVIGNNSVVGSSCITESVVQDNCIIGEGVCINSHSFIGDGTKIDNGAKISETSVSQNVSIGEDSTLKFARIYKDANILPKAVLIGDNTQFARVLKNATVGAGAIISEGVAIPENGNVAPLSIMKKEN